MKVKDLVVGQGYYLDSSPQWETYHSHGKKVTVLDTTGWTRNRTFGGGWRTEEPEKIETQSGVVPLTREFAHRGNGVLVRIEKSGFQNEHTEVVQASGIRGGYDAIKAHLAEQDKQWEKNRLAKEKREIALRERRQTLEDALKQYSVRPGGYRDDAIELNLDDRTGPRSPAAGGPGRHHPSSQEQAHHGHAGLRR